MTTRQLSEAGKVRRLAHLAHQHRELVTRITNLEHDAHRLGMHVTGHALNRAKNALGWEIQGNVEEAGNAARDVRR